MTNSPALDLSKVDPPTWRILIGQTAYGPYTLGQLQGFIGEGRIALQTKISNGDGQAFAPAETYPALQPALRAKWQRAEPRAIDEDTAHNYLVVARFSIESDLSIVQALNNLGTFGEAMPGVFILRSKQRLSEVQKVLRARLGTHDQLLVVDATTNRLAWFNLGPEADVHLKTTWDTHQKAARKDAAEDR